MCPKIAPNTWQMGLSYYWWRQLRDGQIEQEFDLETGQIRPFGEMPSNLKKAGWMPITPDLAQKMQIHGEFGFPPTGIAAPAVIELAPGEELIQYKDHMVMQGYLVVCNVCGVQFTTTEKLPPMCPNPACQAEPLEKEDRTVSPFKAVPAEWESTDYVLGIKGKFIQKMNSSGVVSKAL